MNRPRAYIIAPADVSSGVVNYVLEGRHPCRARKVSCPLCGTWALLGTQYPTVDVSALDGDILSQLYFPDSNRLTPMSLEGFADLAARMAPILGPKRPLLPGTALGPIRGKASGEFTEFVWPDYRTLLVRQAVFEALHDAGFELPGIAAEIEYDPEDQELLIELEVQPSARLHPSQRTETCEHCGRWIRKIKKRSRKPGLANNRAGVGTLAMQFFESPPQIEIDAATFDESMPLQRIRDWPSKLIANESFPVFTRDRNLTNIQLTPIDLK